LRGRFRLLGHSSQLRSMGGPSAALVLDGAGLGHADRGCSAYTGVPWRFSAFLRRTAKNPFVDWTLSSRFLSARRWLLWALFADSEAWIEEIGSLNGGARGAPQLTIGQRRRLASNAAGGVELSEGRFRDRAENGTMFVRVRGGPRPMEGNRPDERPHDRVSTRGLHRGLPREPGSLPRQHRLSGSGAPGGGFNKPTSYRKERWRGFPCEGGATFQIPRSELRQRFRRATE